MAINVNQSGNGKLRTKRDAHEEAQRDTKPPLPISSAASPMVPPPAFSLPMPFPFPHPGAAFLPPAPAYPPAPHPATAATHHASSGSSHSSESSTSSQTQQWPFEEQFKQLRPLNLSGRGRLSLYNHIENRECHVHSQTLIKREVQLLMFQLQRTNSDGLLLYQPVRELRVPRSQPDSH
ncbi:hypothetical protein J6590_008816 [Homalodisca vitripennis]|nr:hypothetical protein J6590_008816 [Homalodisca vitripennis]